MCYISMFLTEEKENMRVILLPSQAKDTKSSSYSKAECTEVIKYLTMLVSMYLITYGLSCLSVINFSSIKWFTSPGNISQAAEFSECFSNLHILFCICRT